MKKVLLTGLGDKLGGTESFLRVLITALSQEYDFSILAATSGDYAMKSFLSDRKISVYQLGNIFGLKNVLRRGAVLDAFFSEHHFDIVHINATTLNATYIAKAATRSGARVIFQIHNAQPSGYSALARLLTQVNKPAQRWYLGHQGLTLLSVSDDAAVQVFGHRLTERSVKVVANGIDTSALRFDLDTRQSVRAELGLSERARVALVVARLMPIKNIKRTIELFAQVFDEQLDALVIVGQGPELDQLRTYAHTYAPHVTQRVFFMGQRTDVRRFYSAADLYISTSVAEGLSISVIEAEAAGLPVLASTGVPKMTNVTQRVQFLSLSASDEVWTDQIKTFNLALNPAQRYKDNEIVAASRFSMNFFADEFRRIYNNPN
ncbi:glycosyltransferase [Lacticaseibacillus absianus]|uniref:glycosyltransferase n=1 Tax=Lacticaseibacillus absianus TaxID=2729623 RepID=UPI0015C9AD4B|nr:glycosyltransferase [Lacticaseibacillus absianus]